MTLDENMRIRWLSVMSPLVVSPWLPLLLATPLLYRCLHQYDTLQAFKGKQGGLGTWVSSDLQIFCIILLHWHWWCGSDLEQKLWHYFDGLSEKSIVSSYMNVPGDLQEDLGAVHSNVPQESFPPLVYRSTALKSTKSVARKHHSSSLSIRRGGNGWDGVHRGWKQHEWPGNTFSLVAKPNCAQIKCTGERVSAVPGRTCRGRVLWWGPGSNVETWNPKFKTGKYPLIFLIIFISGGGRDGWAWGGLIWYAADCISF